MIGFRDHAPALIAAFSVFLLTSTAEGTPNVVLEAMLNGVPVVAPAIDGITSLIRHEETGLLFHGGQEAVAAKYVGRLLEDRELALRICDAAKTQVETLHQCGVMAAKFEAMYSHAQEVALEK